MTRIEKAAAIEELKEKFNSNSFFYITDSSTLTVAQINKFRRMCFEKGIEVKVVKNTLAIKALEQLGEEKNFQPLYEYLKGPSTILFTVAANAPAKVISEFRGDDKEKPMLKAAYIDTAIFAGDNQLSALKSLKSKEELVGDIIGLLQSPAKNLISALKSGGNTIAGLVKALEERAS
jgi:large subunit ribosomal protein L10